MHLVVHYVVLEYVCTRVCLFVSADFCECRSSLVPETIILLPPPDDLLLKRGIDFCLIRERYRGFQEICNGTTAAPCNCSSIVCQVMCLQLIYTGFISRLGLRVDD